MHCWRGSQPNWRPSLGCAFVWTGKIHKLSGCSWCNRRTHLACDNRASHGGLWASHGDARCISQTIPRHRFLEIVGYLRFDLKTERRRNLLHDKFALASQLWNIFISNCQKTTSHSISSFFSCKAHCKFIQRMANKQDKFDLNLWLAHWCWKQKSI